MPTIIVISEFFVRRATMLDRPAHTIPKHAASSSITTTPTTPVLIDAPISSDTRMTSMPWSIMRVPSDITLPIRTLERWMGLIRNLSSMPCSRSLTMPMPDWNEDASTVMTITLGAKNCR